MTATLAEVRDGFVETLTDGLSPSVMVYRSYAEVVDAPAVVLGGFEITPGTFDGFSRAAVEVIALCHRNAGDGIDQLDALVDPRQTDSAWAAIVSDPTLGGRAIDAMPIAVDKLREIAVGDTVYYGAPIRCEVMY